MDDVREYMRLFHAGDYHAAHDALEPRWTRSRSRALHGLIQLAVGWHHMARGNLHGARVLWTKALAHLDTVVDDAGGDGDEGVDLEPLRRHLRHALAILPPGRRLNGPPPADLAPPRICLRVDGQGLGGEA